MRPSKPSPHKIPFTKPHPSRPSPGRSHLRCIFKEVDEHPAGLQTKCQDLRLWLGSPDVYGVTELRSAGRFSLVSCLCLSNLISLLGYGVGAFVIVMVS